MLNRAEIPARPLHEEVFVERYDRMLSWALHLSNNDRTQAEDLLHDAFIQFTLGQPNLHNITNLDGYLYGLLRNIHLSQLRSATRTRVKQLSIVEYESAEAGLRSVDPRYVIEAQDQLRRVCHYACIRKETARSASVLILRFFHGYYPSEIAQVLRTTTQAVKVRLRMARLEIRTHLENPENFTLPQDPLTVDVFRAGFARAHEDFLIELRETVFRTRQSVCLPKSQIRKLYRSHPVSPVDTKILGHLVSCRTCLEEVNQVLGLPPLSERFPTDSIGKDKHGGPGGPAGPTGGLRSAIEKWRRQAREVFEHDPQELCVSVNGYPLGSHAVSSETNELALNIDIAEPIHFVEIFSEQQIRLALMNVDIPPPEGPLEQSLRVELSDERALELQLRFSSPWATLGVAYHDPTFKEKESLLSEISKEEFSLLQGETLEPENPPLSLWQRLKFVQRGLINRRFWLRPITVTVIVVALLIVALLYLRRPIRPVLAAELLQKSAAAEAALEQNASLASHRTVYLEERRVGTRKITSRSRIEIWKSAARDLKLRRVYDEKNNLIAGEWSKADGTSTVYHTGAKPRARPSADLAAAALLETGELWRLDVSAKTFSTLTNRSGSVSIDQAKTEYVVNYENRSPSGTVRLVHASLALNRSNLHAVRETLVVERDGEAWEYKFVEDLFEQHEVNTVAPFIFEPDSELLGSSTKSPGQGDEFGSTKTSVSSAAGYEHNVVASRELEIEVSYLLNQIKANLGEQVTLSRNPEGRLHVEALAETEQRKQEILNALRPVIGNPAVEVEVQTVQEAVKRRPQATNRNPATIREVEVSSGHTPLNTELRAYFSARTRADEIDEAIARYSNQVLNHSRQALLHASALKRLVEQFSPDEARSLEPQARAQLSSMIRGQAQSYQRETQLLRQELRKVFEGLSAAESARQTVSDVSRSAGRLLQLSFVVDEAVRSSFTVSAEGNNSTAIKKAQFWSSLAAAESLAASIQQAYQK